MDEGNINESTTKITQKFLKLYTFVIERNGDEVASVSHSSLGNRDPRYLENERQSEKWTERMRERRKERERENERKTERRRIVKGQAEGEEEEEESRVAEKETGFRRAFAIVPDHRACVCTVVMGCQEQTLAARALYTNTIILLLSRVRSYRFANPPWTRSLVASLYLSPASRLIPRRYRQFFFARFNVGTFYTNIAFQHSNSIIR